MIKSLWEEDFQHDIIYIVNINVESLTCSFVWKYYIFIMIDIHTHNGNFKISNFNKNIYKIGVNTHLSLNMDSLKEQKTFNIFVDWINKSSLSVEFIIQFIQDYKLVHLKTGL